MAIAWQNQDAQVATTAGAIYTNDSGETAFITSILIHNTNTTAETVIIYRVPNSAASVGTAAASDILYKVSVQPNETLMLAQDTGPLTLLDGTNDTIQAVTDTVSKVNMFITARVDT